MRSFFKNVVVGAVTAIPTVYLAAKEFGGALGLLSAPDDFSTYVVPIWQRYVLPMLTTDNLAWVTMLAGLATLAWINFGDRLPASARALLRIKPADQKAVSPAPQIEEQQREWTLRSRDPDAPPDVKAGFARLEKLISDLSAQVAQSASRSDLDAVRVSLRQLQEASSQWNEAFRVLEARKKAAYLVRMNRTLDATAKRIEIASEEVPADKAMINEWLAGKTNTIDYFLHDAAVRLDQIGLDGSERLKNEKLKLEEIVRIDPRFKREPDEVDASPDYKKRYNVLKYRLEGMRDSYKYAVDKLRQQSEIDLHL